MPLLLKKEKIILEEANFTTEKLDDVAHHLSFSSSLRWSNEGCCDAEKGPSF
jgi:hypothetical protein